MYCMRTHFILQSHTFQRASCTAENTFRTIKEILLNTTLPTMPIHSKSLIFQDLGLDTQQWPIPGSGQLSILKHILTENIFYKIRSSNKTKPPFVLQLLTNDDYIQIYILPNSFYQFALSFLSNNSKSMNFRLKIGRSKLKSHTNWLQENAQNLYIFYYSSTTIRDI